MQLVSLARHGAAMALLGLAASAAWSTSRPAAAVLHYEMRVTEGKMPPVKMERRIWVKGRHYRVEVISPQGKQITISGPSGTFVIPPGSNEAVRVDQSQAQGKDAWATLFSDVAGMRRQRRVGSEVLNGRRVEIFEQRLDGKTANVVPGVKGSTRVWLAHNLPMPLKAVTTLEPDSRTVLILKSMTLNPPIPDSLFALPEGVSMAVPRYLPGMVPAAKPRRGVGRR